MDKNHRPFTECWNIKRDSPERVTPPTRVFTYFYGSYCAAMRHYADSMVCLHYLQIPFILLHCYCSRREPFLLFSHCSLAYFTICYKYCCVDSSPLSRLATARVYKHWGEIITYYAYLFVLTVVLLALLLGEYAPVIWLLLSLTNTELYY